MRWQSIVDFIALAAAMYLLLRWSREARALRLALSILALRVGALLANQLELLITSWILDAATVLTLLVLVIGFQPELRRAVMRLDLPGRSAHEGQLPALAAIATAAQALAKARVGALIVLVQDDSIGELVTGGVAIDARVSPELLLTIFQKNSPLHDGAVVVDGDQIARAGVILPLSQRRVPDHFGTRHRAAMGLTERSDAVVLVVSEERGAITMMREGSAQALADGDAVLTGLRSSQPVASTKRRGNRRTDRRAVFTLVTTSLALSALIWSATFLLPGRSVRVQTVPVEFTNVPTGMTIAAQSAETLQVWLRGTEFVLGSVNLAGLVARCDLSSAHEGTNVIRLRPSMLEAPPGVRVEGLAPQQLRVRLTTSPSIVAP
jgi:uncharacterized protein (TIGR00159 family)